MTTEQMEAYRDDLINVLRQQASAAGISSVETEPFVAGDPLLILLEMKDGVELVLELDVL
jgi:SpoU rRNA methylase family enzyme